MENLKELSFEECLKIEGGGGPISDWFCKKTKEIIAWWNSTPEEVVDLCSDGKCVLV